jgi:hypothetical protein
MNYTIMPPIEETCPKCENAVEVLSAESKVTRLEGCPASEGKNCQYATAGYDVQITPVDQD